MIARAVMEVKGRLGIYFAAVDENARKVLDKFTRRCDKCRLRVVVVVARWREREGTMGSDKDCYEKAVARGQRTFTLVAQDYTAPATICEWIKRNILHCPAEKLREALEAAIDMRGFEHTKRAD